MTVSDLDYSEREDAIRELFEAVKVNPYVDDTLAAELFARYYGFIGVYIGLGYTLILDHLDIDTDPFVNSVANPANGMTVLMAIKNFVK